MPPRTHEHLEVYQRAVRIAADLELAARHAPPGRADIRGQLRRASLSIPLNIAEGAGEFSPLDKARFYRYARRSATECMSVLDVLRRLLSRDAPFQAMQDALRDLVRSLTALILVHERRALGGGAEGGDAPSPPPPPSPGSSAP